MKPYTLARKRAPLHRPVRRQRIADAKELRARAEPVVKRHLERAIDDPALPRKSQGEHLSGVVVLMSPLVSGRVDLIDLNRMKRHSARDGALSLDQGQALARQIGWAAAREGLRLERGLSFLATTGSAAPFIGLFGTVIGIINAFQEIGRSGSASLAVVAPGIAEALIATAVGLFAAIPATIFYNHFVSQLRSLTAAIDLFTADCEGDLLREAGVPESRSSSARAQA
ncbi:MAG: MotA/TolQ/ExbB proton channel family protein [Myxococcales bacterium]|nr:MotA/TolQ/ExbB proton channel family protein [Myxococcales bacterium]